jgi:hypothetical protein
MNLHGRGISYRWATPLSKKSVDIASTPAIREELKKTNIEI